MTHWAKKDANGNDVLDSSGNTVYEETSCFKTIYPNAADKSRIIDLITIELTGKDSNGNTRTRKGKSAGS